MGDQVPWPPPPREPGPWSGGPPVSPPGNTPLPPLPGAGGVVHGSGHQTNPWASNTPVPTVNIPGPGGPPVPPPTGPVVVDRAPRALIVASIVVVLAMVAGGAYVLIKGGRHYPSAWDPKVAPIARWVEKERKLTYDHPVQVNFLSEAEYRARSTEGIDDGSAETKQYWDEQAAELRALGFLSGDVDLAQANNELSDSGTLAFYDQDEKQVFVRGSDMTPALRVTLAHELTHVLQDQHFDLRRVNDLDSGPAGVLRALAEGDATKVEDAYVSDVLTADERAAYDKESQQTGDDAQAKLDEKVPPILTTLFASPYILGPELIDLLDQRDGWKAIDAALQDPPSEEALFDPLTYGTDAAKPVEVTATAPTGTELIDESEFGPTALYLLLASRLDPHQALAATDGWGGDHYVVYRKDDQVCITTNFVTDTPDDAKELAVALGSWVEGSPKGSAAVSTGDGQVRFRSCDPGKDAAGAGDVSPDLLVVPVSRTEVYLQGLDAGVDQDKAGCYANEVVDRFSVAQMTDPQYLGTAPAQRELADARRACGL